MPEFAYRMITGRPTPLSLHIAAWTARAAAAIYLAIRWLG